MSISSDSERDGEAEESADDRPVVYDLDPRCPFDDVEEDAMYHAKVNGVVQYGVFVDLSEEVSGLVHESNLQGSYATGDKLIVELESVRDDGDLAFAERQPDDYRTVAVAYDDSVDGDDLAQSVGESVSLDGEVVQINQTGGPTIFQVRDGARIVPCAAFEQAGVRAYPDIAVEDLVTVRGRVEERDDAHQIEVESLEVLKGEAAADTRERLRTAKREAAEPHDVEPFVEWEAMDPLLEELRSVARRLLEAVIEGRPIRMRHHADGDGICASVPLAVALENVIEDVHADGDAARHLVKRLPSKAPYYEMEDVTRDLNHALESRERHGQKLPLLLMLDNGSTEEDAPAYRNLAHYDVPIVVIDHHHPDPETVEELVDDHVNPYLHGEDYRITTGMLSVELARMLDPSITDDLEHVPAVAGLSDRSEADAMTDYLDLAENAGYDRDRLEDIGEALDYATHWLRYDDGDPLIRDVLNVDGDPDRHDEIVTFLAEKAERDVEEQLDAAMNHVEHESLDNEAELYRIDVENAARRFTYPAPGKTTGTIHDRKVEETGDPVITIGYGPDFAVLRSDGVRLDIPDMVEQLRDEIPGGGVSGGGHLVVGSIKFVEGRREDVLDALVEKMADAEIDEELQSSSTFTADA
ncbi:MAG: DHH family phosphoesterase [Halorhabdus sp.]